MKTLYYSHPDFLLHDTGSGHPERAARLKAIDQALVGPEFAGLIRVDAPMGTEAQVQLIHPAHYLQALRAALPKDGPRHLTADTMLSPGSLTAAFRAVGAVCDAVDQVMTGHADRAFCAVRPPGHHAETSKAMGFCLFNNIAIAAEYARQRYHLQRLAIVDFDVHHGNGTQTAFYHQPQVMYASSHEMPHYPGTGDPSETGAGNIINVPLAAGDTGATVRERYQRLILPALAQFKPQLLLISAGFDAHRDDPLADIKLVEDDYRWVTQALADVADRYSQGRILSALEGGYNLKALGASVAAHVKVLLGG